MEKNNPVKFTVSGQGMEMEVSEFFSSSSAIKKSPGLTNGTVILGTITRGKTVVGQKIELKLPGEQTIFDKVVRIEQEKKPLQFAIVGQGIGICLAETRAEILAASLDK